MTAPKFDSAAMPLHQVWAVIHYYVHHNKGRKEEWGYTRVFDPLHWAVERRSIESTGGTIIGTFVSTEEAQGAVKAEMDKLLD